MSGTVSLLLPPSVPWLAVAVATTHVGGKTSLSLTTPLRYRATAVSTSLTTGGVCSSRGFGVADKKVNIIYEGSRNGQLLSRCFSQPIYNSYLFFLFSSLLRYNNHERYGILDLSENDLNPCRSTWKWIVYLVACPSQKQGRYLEQQLLLLCPVTLLTVSLTALVTELTTPLRSFGNKIYEFSFTVFSIWRQLTVFLRSWCGPKHGCAQARFHTSGD